MAVRNAGLELESRWCKQVKLGNYLKNIEDSFHFLARLTRSERVQAGYLDAILNYRT